MPDSKYSSIVDIHCHILPGLDDGPSSWEESVGMVRVACSNNIKKIVATPHWIQGTSWQPKPDTVFEYVMKINELLETEEIDVEILPGMEIGINENLFKLLEQGEIITLANTNNILIEIPFMSLPLGLEEIIFELVSNGYKPILAHPERNKDLQSEPRRILDLIDRGAFVQITAGSLCGYWGDYARDCSIEFVKSDAVFVVASDGHSVDSRPPIIDDGLKVLEGLVSEDKIIEILNNCHKLLVKN